MSSYSETNVIFYHDPFEDLLGTFGKLSQKGWKFCDRILSVKIGQNVAIEASDKINSQIESLALNRKLGKSTEINMLEPLAETIVGLHIHWDKQQVVFCWDSRSPCHPKYDRIIDPAWALDVVYCFCESIDADPQFISHESTL